MLNFVTGVLSATVKVVASPVVVTMTGLADFYNAMEMNNEPSKTGAYFRSIGRDLDKATK